MLAMSLIIGKMESGREIGALRNFCENVSSSRETVVVLVKKVRLKCWVCNAGWLETVSDGGSIDEIIRTLNMVAIPFLAAFVV